MRVFTRAAIAAILFHGLSGCSSSGSLFSFDAGNDASTSDVAHVQAAPTNDSCAKLAAQRADDAVLAFYVSEGSPEQKEVYQTTYGECVAWHNR